MIDKPNILFLSVGRRVSLIKFFKQEISNLKLDCKVYGTDFSQLAPARFVCDESFTSPRVNSPEYIPFLLDLCEKMKIGMVLSLIDSDLILLAQNNRLFKEKKIKLINCGLEINEISFDKRKTHDFFTKNGFKTPHVFSAQELQAKRNSLNFPLLIKPYDGSCSKGVTKINNLIELNFFQSYIPNAIVQEFIQGQEYTIDVYIDHNQKTKCVVPRKRIETRAGEVSKGQTTKNDIIIDEVKRLMTHIKEKIGCITVQAFLTSTNEVIFIEINPRFGGGYPLSYHAGANFPKWLLEEYFKLTSYNSEYDQTWNDQTTMLRYDDEIILNSNNLVLKK